MTEEQRLLRNDRRRNQYRARQKNVESEATDVDTSQSEIATRSSMMTEEQRVAERERCRVRNINHRESITDEERLLQNERRRNQYRARQQNVDYETTDVNTSQRRFPARSNSVTEEQRAAERERCRVRNMNRRQSMTHEERLLQNEHRRNQYRARQLNMEIRNLPSSSTSNNETTLFIPRRSPRFIGCGSTTESTSIPRRCPRFIGCRSTTESLDQGQSRDPQTTIMKNSRKKQLWRAQHKSIQEKMTEQQKHAFDERQRIAYQNRKTRINEASASSSAEVTRLLGCVSRVVMNTSEGYMELGHQHRAPIHTTFNDMLEFDEQINNPEDDDCNESHQEDVHEVELPDLPESPELLQLYTVQSKLGAHFRKNIRFFNHVFAFTSIGISQGTDFQDVRLHIKEQTTFLRTYNMPTSPQVAAVLVGGEEPSEVLPRDIIVETNSGKLLNVPDTACFYDPLQYPLLHPYGSFGWDLTIFGDNAKRISCRAYYAYMLQIRENQQSILLHGGKLLQQYVVDNYVKISTMQLRWVRDNQRTFRVDWYSGVLDSLDANTDDIGQRVIIPPSYTGSPRDMHQRYHDVMALVQKYGKPDLFITMTCNPNWEEIQRNLKPGQQAQARSDDEGVSF
ncbi:uncharacterized protein LOC113360655 [Papaver somniferum]|uniref:uncharacterized protein LOC113360655 n=1 Tax=Papaver somniferum TaxID=3469 RepID=UPI000E6F9C17|nr:uncharacterized protein LOC113360655 [Papaver somniferum]